jgi:hypothetical protein
MKVPTAVARYLGLALSLMGTAIFVEYLRRRRSKLRLERGCVWDAKENCWRVEGRSHDPSWLYPLKSAVTWSICRTGYQDVCELLKSPHIRANYLPSFLSQLPPEVPTSRFAFLVNFFGRWPLFQVSYSDVLTQHAFSQCVDGKCCCTPRHSWL